MDGCQPSEGDKVVDGLLTLPTSHLNACDLNACPLSPASPSFYLECFYLSCLIRSKGGVAKAAAPSPIYGITQSIGEPHLDGSNKPKDQ